MQTNHIAVKWVEWLEKVLSCAYFHNEMKFSLQLPLGLSFAGLTGVGSPVASSLSGVALFCRIINSLYTERCARRISQQMSYPSICLLRNLYVHCCFL